MGTLTQVLAILSILLICYSQSFADCGGALLHKDRVNKYLHKIEKLRPDVKFEFGSYEELLIALKKEQYAFAHDYVIVGRGEQLPSEMQIQVIRKNFEKTYDLADLSAEEMANFYTNSLQALINKIYLEFLKFKAHELLYGPPQEVKDLEQEEVKSLMAYLYEINSRPTSFEERIVDAERGLELLQNLKVPTPEEVKSKIFEGSQKPEFCCVSAGGCRLCPLNRSYLQVK